MNTRAWFLLVAITWATSLHADAGYPQNPLKLGASVYVSHQGVYRFHPTRATPLWSSLAGIETFAPVSHGDLLLVGSTQGLYALHKDDGSIVWHIEQNKTLFTPSVAKQAFAGSLHGELYSLDPASGRIKWRRQFNGWIYSPAFNEERTRLWTGGQQHRVYAIDGVDGTQQQALDTSQELVFSPVDLGDGRIGVNLFDGSTLLLQASGKTLETTLAGNSQPTGLVRRDRRIYRSHRDGSLSVFDLNQPRPAWQKTLTSRNLTLHPAQSGFLLLSDQDRSLILFDVTEEKPVCSLEPSGNWMLPLQLDSDSILVFQKFLQPPRLRLVQIQAKCK